LLLGPEIDAIGYVMRDKKGEQRTAGEDGIGGVVSSSFTAIVAGRGRARATLIARTPGVGRARVGPGIEARRAKQQL